MFGLLVFGCNNDSGFFRSAKPKTINNVLTLRLAAEPTLLNPILSTDVYAAAVEGLLFSGLMRVNDELMMEPDMAERYTISPDGCTYLFYLKRNVLWHDGQPFTARDVVFTFDLILDPKTNTVRRSGFVIDGEPIKFEAVDDYTVRATLPKPFAPFLTEMGMSILPRHVLSGRNINTCKFNQNPIGTGPFVFQEWRSGQYVRLVKNKNYYCEPAKLDQVLFKIIRDTNTALMALNKGEIDLCDIPAKDYKRYQHKRGLTVYRYPQLQYSYLGFNFKHRFLGDVRVRQAMTHAVPKEALVKAVLKGLGQPAYIPVSPSLWAYPSGNVLNCYPYDPDKSRLLLESAGFHLNNKTGVYGKDGHPLSFTVLTTKGSATGERTAEILQQYLARVGIKMEIQLMEWRSLLQRINAPDDPKPFDAALLGWSLGLDPDAFSIWHSQEYPNGFNYIGYKNEPVDRLLEAGRITMDRTARKAIYRSFYEEIARDAPYLFLFYPDNLTVVNQRVGGLSKPGPAGLLNKIESVYIINSR